MDAKEKAKQIVNKIKDDLFNKRNIKITDEDAVLCALIAVDEIINNYEDRYKYCNSKIYWEEVKKEIEKL